MERKKLKLLYFVACFGEALFATGPHEVKTVLLFDVNVRKTALRRAYGM